MAEDRAHAEELVTQADQVIRQLLQLRAERGTEVADEAPLPLEATEPPPPLAAPQPPPPPRRRPQA